MLLPYLFVVLAFSDARKIRVYNKCPFTVWPGIQGSHVPAGGGFRLLENENKVLDVSDRWTDGKIWARRGCDAQFNCDTGSCKNAEQCDGTGGTAPFTVAEFSLKSHMNKDFYSVNFLNGYNLPILIDVEGGEGCQRAGSCIRNLLHECPSHLRVVGGSANRTVGCHSTCTANTTDKNCCRGVYHYPSLCPTDDIGKFFKKHCPNSYCYPFDDNDLIYTCENANYVVQIC